MPIQSRLSQRAVSRSSAHRHNSKVQGFHSASLRCSFWPNWAFNATAVCCRQNRASMCGALTSVLGIMSDAASNPPGIIAVRELQFQYAAGSSEAVRVSIGIPVPAEEPETWCCTCTIIGTSIQKSFPTVGIDSVQALTLALGTLPDILEFLSRKHEGEFHFLEERGHCFARVASQS